MIEETIDRFGDQVCVACSFGKDSMVVLDLVREIKPDVKVVNYIAAPFPETFRFKKEMKKKLELNLTELRPFKGMNYWRCVEKYGLPGIRTRKGKYHSPRCCYYMKEKPMQRFIKEKDMAAVFTGITLHESWNRKKLAWRYDDSEVVKDDWEYCGMRYYAKSWSSWQVHPIMSWTEKDVWKYTADEEIPVNPVYTKWGGVHTRVGCLPCTAYLSWERKLRRSHPKLYKYLKKIQLKDELTLDTYFLKAESD